RGAARLDVDRAAPAPLRVGEQPSAAAADGKSERRGGGQGPGRILRGWGPGPHSPRPGAPRAGGRTPRQPRERLRFPLRRACPVTRLRPVDGGPALLRCGESSIPLRQILAELPVSPPGARTLP